MIKDGSKTGVSIAPPHELNVRKFAESRASELEGLHSVVANRLNNDFRSQRNKRKRTTGHDNRVAKKRFRKKQRVGLGDSSCNDSLQKDEKKIPRHVRRRILLKKNPQSGFCTSGDGTKRLRTHVWHAKRFTMTKLWEFHIPLNRHGKGTGSRALLKKLKSGVLIHDASYYGTVKLEGPQDMLLSVLSSVLVPSPSEHSEEISDIISGVIFGSAMLHHGGKNCFPSIAPVTYMWRPLRQITTDTEELNLNGFNVQQRIYNGTTFREIWVWIHAAAFTEAHDALRSACERQMDMIGGSAKCISLEGQLAMLELIGSKAFQLLDKALLPASCIYEKSWHLKKCTADENKDKRELEETSISEISNQISSSAVIPFTVKDPRTSTSALTKKWNVIASDKKLHGVFGFEESETKGETNLSPPKHEDECVFGDLWDVSEGIYPPVEESVACMEKYHQRREFIKLGHKTSGNQNTSVKGKYSRSCPILLLKNEKYKDSIIRCSIVLPLSWVKVFWNTFMSNGAHAIGLKEKHWISCEIGLPYFPFDYPDCNAYSNLMAMEAIAADHKARSCPPSKTPQKIPIPPPWNCVQLSFVKTSSDVVNSLSQIEEPCSKDDVVDDLVNNTGCEISETSGVPFEGFVARTYCKLSDFLKTINCSDLLLFPRVRNQKNSLYKFMKDEEFLKQEGTIVSKTKHERRRCFLRVLLHAYKEGVFEQGAVICAPLTADIMIWTRSVSDNQQLQIPESSVRSYFFQLPSGKWELQIPEHPPDQESYRWPIGFITTGFVRGSKKAMAGALCEASLLSRLRLEQWKAMPARQRRKEIYVLVRNMRSTAYRLALATIVLEQQEDDVKYI